MEFDFLEDWFEGDYEDVLRFIYSLALDDLSFADETVTVNGVNEPLIFDGFMYFDRFMNVYIKCSVCGKLHLCDDVMVVGMFSHYGRTYVCKDCFESGRVRPLLDKGKPFRAGGLAYYVESESYSLNKNVLQSQAC